MPAADDAHALSLNVRSLSDLSSVHLGASCAAYLATAFLLQSREVKLMPFAWCEQARRNAAAKYASNMYLDTHHGDALIVAALDRRALSAHQAASIVAAGAHADLGCPFEGLGPGDFVWGGDLMRAGVRFFAAAAVAASEMGAVAELARQKFTFVRAADLPGEAADFVRVLR